jgi:DNA uptake protein ComE-like DNA-binding protein
LLLLEQHNVVLGRYNNGKKVKALTPAVDVYKQVRSQIRRTKYLSTSEVAHIKQTTSLLLQKELKSNHPPPISFWVDINKAKQAGKLTELQTAHPQLRYCQDFDGEQVVFVEDHEDFFLKADIDTKRRKTSTTTSTTSSPTSTTSNSHEASEALDINAEASVISGCSRATSAAQTVSTLRSSPSSILLDDDDNNSNNDNNPMILQQQQQQDEEPMDTTAPMQASVACDTSIAILLALFQVSAATAAVNSKWDMLWPRSKTKSTKFVVAGSVMMIKDPTWKSSSENLPWWKPSRCVLDSTINCYWGVQVPPSCRIHLLWPCGN